MNLRIDRLTLRLSHLSEAESRRLVRLVGDGLAAAQAPTEGGYASSMVVPIDARPGEAIEVTARRIVAAMIESSARVIA